MVRSSPSKKRTATEQDSRQSEQSESSKRTRSNRTRIQETEHVDEQDKLSEIDNGNSSLSVQAIKDKLKELAFLPGDDQKEVLEKYMLELDTDKRAGVITCIASIRDALLRSDIETQRIDAMMDFESKAYSNYVKERDQLISNLPFSLSKVNKSKEIKKIMSRNHLLIGIDEVGVGPLAGPIISCAIAFSYPILVNNLISLQGIDDSKKLTTAKREKLSEIIKGNNVGLAFGIVTAKEVDEINPLQGSLLAMKRALEGLEKVHSWNPLYSLYKDQTPSLDVFVDHHTIPNLDDTKYRQTSITKGDSKSIVIAAASIMAKVHRDQYMTELHGKYPHFSFDRNAGYGTKDHLDQLKKGSICPEHRLSFEPVRQAHRVSMGLPLDISPKKKTRAKSRSISPTKTAASRSKLELGSASSTAITPEKSSTVAKSPITASIFSLTWWTRLLPASSSEQ